jgi:hypothetical protein
MIIETETIQVQKRDVADIAVSVAAEYPALQFVPQLVMVCTITIITDLIGCGMPLAQVMRFLRSLEGRICLGGIALYTINEAEEYGTSE